MGSGRWGSGRLALMVGVAALVAGAVVLTLNVVGDTPAPGVVEDVTPLGIRVDPRVAKAPGTELFGDVTVQPGSRLVGTTSPRAGWDRGSPGGRPPTKRSLVLDGDPLEVWGRYKRVGHGRAACGQAIVHRTRRHAVIAAADVERCHHAARSPCSGQAADGGPASRRNELECTTRVRDGSLWLEAGVSRYSGLPVGPVSGSRGSPTPACRTSTRDVPAGGGRDRL